MMKNFIQYLSFAAIILLLGSSCKSEFEKIRTSGDPKAILEQANNYYAQEEYLKAQQLYELIIPSYRGKKELEDIYFKYAYTYYNLNKFILASYYFKNFSSTFPSSSRREDIDFMSAYSNVKLSPSFRLEQSYTTTAIDELQQFINTYPSSPRVAEANKLIDELRSKLEEKAYESAKLYYDMRQYQAAIVALENVIKDFPETTNAEEIRYMATKSWYDLAVNSVYEKKEERYKKAVKYSDDFLKKYKDSKYAKDVLDFYNDSVQSLKLLTNGRYKDKGTGVGP